MVFALYFLKSSYDWLMSYSFIYITQRYLSITEPLCWLVLLSDYVLAFIIIGHRYWPHWLPFSKGYTPVVSLLGLCLKQSAFRIVTFKKIGWVSEINDKISFSSVASHQLMGFYVLGNILDHLCQKTAPLWGVCSSHKIYCFWCFLNRH